jgi:thiamine transport system substrate-binding protein
VEEKDSNFQSIEFAEGHPIQVEFAAIPETCRNCEAAKKFISFLMSAQAQKIVMSKNYMLPVNKTVQEGTAFDTIKLPRNIKTLQSSASPVKATKSELQSWLNLWSEISRSESQ